MYYYVCDIICYHLYTYSRICNMFIAYCTICVKQKYTHTHMLTHTRRHSRPSKAPANPTPRTIMNQYLQLEYNLGSLHHGDGNI